MYLLSACLLLGCVVLPSHCYQLKKTLCQGSSCYYLYELNNSYLSWDQSYEACGSEGLEMLRIDSNQTQTLVERLLQNVPQTTDRRVWIGGRRSNDNTWRFINGTVFNKQSVTEGTSQTDLYCLYARLCKGINPEYHAENCDEKTSPSRLLCQSDPNETGRCRSPDVLYGNKCYMKTSFGGDGIRVDWYNGQTYCSQNDIQGDIAYSYLHDDTLINNIIDLVHPGADCAQIWLGVRRRIWFWKTASTKYEDNQPIDYYNWDDQITENSTQNQCIYIDVDQRNKWQTGLHSSYLRYFLCMKASYVTDKTTSISRSTATTISTTRTRSTTTTRSKTRTRMTKTTKATTTTTATTTTKTTTGTRTTTPITTNASARETETTDASDKPTGTQTDNMSPNAVGNDAGFEISYIIAIVVGVVVLAVVVGLAVFFVLKKRRKQTSTKQSKVEELQHGEYDDVIDPYGVVRAENPKNVEVRHKEAPSGDLYAVSTKQANKINVNKTGEDKIPEVVYAQPKKKGNQKTETSKNSQEHGTAKSGSDVDTEKPSGGENSTGDKHTEHFEAPSGEVYARVIREGKDADE